MVSACLWMRRVVYSYTLLGNNPWRHYFSNNSLKSKFQIQSLLRKVKRHTGPLKADDLCDTLYGLKKVTSRDRGVKAVLHELAKKIRGNEQPLTTKKVHGFLIRLSQKNVDSALIPVLEKAFAIISPSSYFKQFKNELDETRRAYKCLNFIKKTITESKDTEINTIFLELVESFRQELTMMQVDALMNIHPLKREIDLILENYIPLNTLMALQGLQNMCSEDGAEVMELVEALGEKLRECQDEFTVQDICNCLSGLKNMSCNHQSVSGTLSVILSKVYDSKEAFNGQQIACAFYGLQSMNLETKLMKALVAELTLKVAGSVEIKPAHIAKALCSLRNSSSEYAIIRNLVRELTIKLEGCKDNLCAQEISDSLFGLQNMSSCSEIRQLLRLLSLKVHSCKKFNTNQLSNAFFGLQLMNSDDGNEVMDIFNALILKSYDGLHVSKSRISMILFGFRNIRIDSSTMAFVDRLIDILHQFNDRNTIDDIRLAYQYLVLVCSPGSNFALLIRNVPSIQTRITEARMNLIQLLHSKSIANVDDSRNKSERKYQKIIYRALESIPSIEVVSNSWLFGFEADIVIRKTIPGSSRFSAINIELDGTFHKIDRTKHRFCKLRDQHLRRDYGVHVERWDLVSLSLNHSVAAIIESTQQIVRDKLLA